VEFVTGAFKKIVKGYRALRRGKVVQALRILTGRKNLNVRDIPDILSDAWLSFAFGASPIVQDVYTSAVILDEGLRKGTDLLEVSSKLGEPIHGEVSSFTGTYRSEVQGKIEVGGRVVYKIDDPTLFAFEQLGLTNPAAITWELVPFSFLVDWFLPVGDFLRSIVPPQGVSFVDGYIYRKIWGQSQHSTSIQGSPGWFTHMRTEEIWKDRYILTDFPRVRFTVPDLSLSYSKITTAMALLQRTAITLGDIRPSGRRLRF
jgi:hypothetical protein